MLALLAIAFVVVPFVASEYVYRARADPVPDPGARGDRPERADGLLRPDLARLAAPSWAVGAYAAYNLAVRLPFLNPLRLHPARAASSRRRSASSSACPSLRIKGFYLAVATLAAQFFCDWAFLRIKWFTNYTPSGSVNAPPLADVRLRPVLADGELPRRARASPCVLGLAAKNIVRGHIGRQWMAIRDMDIAAEIIGMRPMHAKLTAFAVSSFLIGVAGALWAFVYLGSWEPAAFAIDRSFQLMFMVIIGGLGSILGSLLGAIFIVLLPIFLNQACRRSARCRLADQHRDGLAFRGDDFRRPDRVLPDGRAAWPRATCGRSPRRSCGCGRSRIEREKLGFRARTATDRKEETMGLRKVGADGAAVAVGRRHRRRDGAGAERAVHSRPGLSHRRLCARTASRSPTALPTTSPC